MKEKNNYKKENYKVVKKKFKRVSLFRLFALVFIIFFLIFCVYAITKESYSVTKDLFSFLGDSVSQKLEDKNLKNIQEKKVIKSAYKVFSREEVLDKISGHITLPKEAINIFVKIKNPEELRKISSIYENVEEGDYLIAYKNLAVVYNADSDKLIKTITLK